MKRHRYVSRNGPLGDARLEARALARAENEGWPIVAEPPRRTPLAAPAPREAPAPRQPRH